MNTVKLHWIETDKNDLMVTDTYVIENSDFFVNQNSHVHDAIEYVLPDDYTIGVTMAGETAIFDHLNNYCVLDRHNKCPRLSSAAGVVYLKKHSPRLLV